MNIQLSANQGLVVQSSAKMLPQHPQFDFDQWASAVKKQMQPVLDKKLILPATFNNLPVKETDLN